RPPKLLHSALSSSTGSPLSAVTRQAFVVQGKTPGIVLQSPAPNGRLLAVFAGREVAAIDRLLQERLLPVRPELADVGIRLDDRVPELRFRIAEHLLLLDLLDVDVLDWVAHVVHRDRTAHGVDFHALHDLDEL